jgi:serine/threonine protein kinase
MSKLKVFYFLCSEKSIALQILKFLKYVKSLNVLYLDLSTKLIEVDVNEKIKFINFENAIFSDKNASSFTFLNISVSSDLAP